MVCFPTDIGPAATVGWETTAELTPGKVLVFPFSHGDATDGEQYGAIAIVGATGADTQGYDLRGWHSRAPGGAPLEGDCTRILIADDVYWWNQNKDVAGYCRLPDDAGTVYWNYALCTSTDDDFHCASATAEFASERYRFHIAPRVSSY